MVAPVEGRDEMLDMQLKAKDGLLGIDCSYPSDHEMETLPRVWLTSNETHWDTTCINTEEDITITPCWDGTTDFTAATDIHLQEYEEINRFNCYVLKKQETVNFMIQALGLVTMGSVMYKVYNQTLEEMKEGKTKIVSAVGKPTTKDYEK